MRRKEMIYTPQEHIPLGIPVKMGNNRYGLMVKKSKSPQCEIVPLDYLFAMAVRLADNAGYAESPDAEVARTRNEFDTA